MTTPASVSPEQPHQPLRPEEADLAARLAEAASRPVAVWRRVGAHAPDGPAAESWSYDRSLGPAGEAVAAEPAGTPPAAVREASRARQAVAAPAGEATDQVAVRLGPYSNAYGVVEVTREAAAWVAKLFDCHVAQWRTDQTADELVEENESFAGQMSSDLEELTFLRAMVAHLAVSRVDEGLAGLATTTLPVLNETVRARCLAYLASPHPKDPYQAVPTVVEGDEPASHAVLEAIVRRFGPKAGERTLVRNWDADDLPDNATPGDDGDRLPGVRSLVLTPMRAGPRLLGWLVAVNRTPPGEFDLESSWQLASGEFGSGEATLIATTAAVLATHTANVDLLREKEQLLVSMVRTLVSAIESKDKYTRGHSERVALYTRRLAEEMGYEPSELEDIYLSALLHDVGKIGVPDAVLNKEGKLTDTEYAEISRHPEEGWAILGDLEHLRYIMPGVLHHHERWDGRGYPDGLAGEAIPRDGRVMAVADAFDAMTSDRSYRKGMPVEKAESILREGSGVQWDPACIDAFFACREDLLRIKADYQENEREPRTRTAARDASEPLVHEIAGLTDG